MTHNLVVTVIKVHYCTRWWFTLGVFTLSELDEKKNTSQMLFFKILHAARFKENSILNSIYKISANKIKYFNLVF